MKKNYKKPTAEFIDFRISEELLNEDDGSVNMSGGYDDNIYDDDELGG